MEEENEQLDYDEDELKTALKKAQQLQKEIEKEQKDKEKEVAPVPVKVSSSKAPGTEEGPIALSIAGSTASSFSSPTKCYVNPNFKRPGGQHYRGTASDPNSKPFNARYPYPPHQRVYHQQQIPQTAFYPPIQPQPSHFFPIVSHPSTMQFAPNTNGIQQQFPQIPAGIPLTTTVPNANIYINPSMFNAASISQISQQSSSMRGWDSMVDEFVKKTRTVKPRKYSKSRSSSTSSSTASSRSRSRSRSRSSSSDAKRRRRNSHSPRRRRSKSPENRSTKQIAEQTIECARAIGLDEEYLKKMQEQQRLRDEIARKKSRHRKEIYAREGAETEKRKKVQQADEESKKKKAEGGKPGGNKLRAYLAVVVTNLKGFPNAAKKVAELACRVGPVKKVWQESSSDVHIIFEKHEDAKKFMQQYIGNTTVFGRVIDVTMKKLYLCSTTSQNSHKL